MRTQAERDEARRICEAANKGPWHVSENQHPNCDESPWGSVECVDPRGRVFVWSGYDGKRDAKLAAHARNTYIPLLDAYEELEGEALVLRRALDNQAEGLPGT